MSNEDSSTRTIASVGAVLGVAALSLGVVQSARTGLIAQFTGTANAVAQQNDAALVSQMEEINAKVSALQNQVKALEAKAAAPPPAPAKAKTKAAPE